MEVRLTHPIRNYTGTNRTPLFRVLVEDIDSDEFDGLNVGVDLHETFETFNVSGCGEVDSDENLAIDEHESMWTFYPPDTIPETLSIAIFTQFDGQRQADKIQEYEASATLYSDDGEQIGQTVTHTFSA